MILNILLLILGFVLLIRGADAFVDGSAAVARKFHVPEIIIGLTIVAMGTSAPEAAVSISSVFHGVNGVAIGNILGSNIVNILLILGVTSLIAPLAVQKNTVKYEIPFTIFITILLMWFGAEYGIVSRWSAGILFALFISFLVYLCFASKIDTVDADDVKPMSSIKILAFIIGGIFALIIGSNLTVNSASNLARMFGVPDRIIGLTIIAFGTSLPELVTCVIAAKKKRVDLAIGNIIGSNIFNILFVLGITGMIHPFVFEHAFLTDAVVAVMVSTILWIFTICEHKLTRGMGIFFLLCYGVYVVSLL